MRRRESLKEKAWRYRGVICVAAIPVLLVLTIITLVPRAPGVEFSNEAAVPARYSIVFDAGSTGSRIHVFKFNVAAGEPVLESDTFEQLKPGLSSYAEDPAAAADSLKPLLDVALAAVPKELHASTAVELRATAGLRLLPGDQADQILAAVRTFLAGYPFILPSDGVTILDGEDEGAYAWLTLNYLLRRLGSGPAGTVAAIDMGGGSIQEAYAVDDASAASAPAGYIKQLKAFGQTYSVYTHSYLGYGLMAGRSQVLDQGDGSRCVPAGANGEYKYGDKVHTLEPNEETSYETCAAATKVALKVGADCGEEATECTFNGAWGGRPDAPGLSQYYISSYFWDRAGAAGILPSGTTTEAVTRPEEFANAARTACATAVNDLQGVDADAAPYHCLDLTYAATILTEGFRVPADAQITLVKQVKYRGETIEAAWPLGAAINSLSSR